MVWRADNVAEPVGTIFLRLLLMTVVLNVSGDLTAALFVARSERPATRLAGS